MQTKGDVEFRKRKCGSSRGKKCKLSLSLKKKQKDSAEEADIFTKEHFPLLSLDVIEDLKKCIVPKNVEKCTNWAEHLFNSWCQQRNEHSDEKVPEGILLTDNHEDLCHWLCVSITKLHKEDGGEYTPRSITQYIAGIQCYITDQKNAPIRLVDPCNCAFQLLHQVLDNQYWELHANGDGRRQKQAEIITLDEEGQLWQTGMLSSESPLSSICAVFYLNGVNFVLQSGDDTGTFIAKFSDALHNALEKASYQIIHTIYLLETMHKIVPYRLGKPKTLPHQQPHASYLTSNIKKSI